MPIGVISNRAVQDTGRVPVVDALPAFAAIRFGSSGSACASECELKPELFLGIGLGGSEADDDLSPKSACKRARQHEELLLRHSSGEISKNAHWRRARGSFSFCPGDPEGSGRGHRHDGAADSEPERSLRSMELGLPRMSRRRLRCRNRDSRPRGRSGRVKATRQSLLSRIAALLANCKHAEAGRAVALQKVAQRVGGDANDAIDGQTSGPSAQRGLPAASPC